MAKNIIEFKKELLSHESSTAIMLYPARHLEKTKAGEYLIDHIPDDTTRDIKNLMDQIGKDRWVDHHHGFGIGIRNLLREGGFDRGPIDMDGL